MRQELRKLLTKKRLENKSVSFVTEVDIMEEGDLIDFREPLVQESVKSSDKTLNSLLTFVKTASSVPSMPSQYGNIPIWLSTLLLFSYCSFFLLFQFLYNQ
jgi:hypothetical protein